MTIKHAAMLALLASLAAPAAAQDAADSFSLTSGIDYSTGKYGTSKDTNILVVPVSARYRTGDLRLSASMPWLRIDGANIIGGGTTGPIVIDPKAPRSTRSGLGDLSLGLNYAIPEERAGIGIDFGARVKLPTASTAEGLGTSATDVSLSAEVSRTFGGVTPFVSGGYRFSGDPAGFDLRDVAFGSVGASVIAGKSVILASYDYRQAASALSEDSLEVFGAFSTPLSKALDVTFYGSVGLSAGAPDFGVGAMVTLKAF